MIKLHEKEKADMTIAVQVSSHPEEADLIKLDKDNKMIAFISKNADHTRAGNLANTGLCIIEPQIVDLMDKEEFNFENYIYPKALEKGMKIIGYYTEEFIEDMGTPERLKKCEDYLKAQ